MMRREMVFLLETADPKTAIRPNGDRMIRRSVADATAALGTFFAGGTGDEYTPALPGGAGGEPRCIDAIRPHPGAHHGVLGH
jgi:hypothetical protein